MWDRNKPCYLTPAGRRQLEAELAELRTVRRPALAESVRELNDRGGFNESTEIDDFMNEQSQLDAHMRDLEYILRHAILIEDGGGGEVVRIGARVTICDGAGEEMHWTLVGGAEANRRQGKISTDSPIGAALVGHQAGETVTVMTPAGAQQYTIVKVE